MKRYRKDRRPGNRPMTDDEWAVIEAAKTSGCVPCLIRARQGKMPRHRVFKFAGWDHCKSGNIRRGHLYGFASCNWHHQGLTIDRPGWGRADFERVYGPSKHYGVVPFHKAFGTDDELIAYQRAHLGLTPPVNLE